MKIFLFLFVMFLSGCTEIKVVGIPDFNSDRYLGKWYEIARLNHPFEVNMDSVTAEYSLREDGMIKVVNRGYNTKKMKWEDAEARAVTTKIPGQFKVYFIPIIAGNYKIAYLSEDYSLAVVSGGTKKFLWFLARDKKISKEDLDRMLSVAAVLGYDTSKLIYPVQ